MYKCINNVLGMKRLNIFFSCISLFIWVLSPICVFIHLNSTFIYSHIYCCITTFPHFSSAWSVNRENHTEAKDSYMDAGEMDGGGCLNKSPQSKSYHYLCQKCGSLIKYKHGSLESWLFSFISSCLSNKSKSHKTVSLLNTQK